MYQGEGTAHANMWRGDHCLQNSTSTAEWVWGNAAADACREVMPGQILQALSVL